MAGAAEVLQEVHVETYGALTKTEKADFILEQVSSRRGWVARESQPCWQRGNSRSLQLVDVAPLSGNEYRCGRCAVCFFWSTLLPGQVLESTWRDEPPART